MGTNAFCLYAINKSELEEEGSRPIWLDSSVGAVGREELIESIMRAMRDADS